MFIGHGLACMIKCYTIFHQINIPVAEADNELVHLSNFDEIHLNHKCCKIHSNVSNVDCVMADENLKSGCIYLGRYHVHSSKYRTFHGAVL